MITSDGKCSYCGDVPKKHEYTQQDTLFSYYECTCLIRYTKHEIDPTDKQLRFKMEHHNIMAPIECPVCRKGNLMFHRENTEASCPSCGVDFAVRDIVPEVLPLEGVNNL